MENPEKWNNKAQTKTISSEKEKQKIPDETSMEAQIALWWTKRQEGQV